jgi:magnesium-transporting ATPase (P-type)
MNNCRAFRTILTAGLVVGVLDLSSALVIWWQRGVALEHGLQGITAGLLGTKSFEGGMTTAGLGVAIHFFVAFVVVLVFYLASRKLPFLAKQPFAWGILYGIGVYLVMYWIVLPSAFPTFRHRPSNELLALAIHICLIGLPTAFIMHRYSESMDQSS